jgi:hypothetical protein
MALQINYDALQHALDEAGDAQALHRAIVDAPFDHKVELALLHLGIIVLLRADKSDGMIHRIALSNTEFAKGTTDFSVKRFEDIKIPIDYAGNSIAKAIRTGKPQLTTDWQYLFAPALTPEEARFNQAGGAIACSVAYPLVGVGDGGALIYSYYQYPEKMGSDQRGFMKTYSGMVAKALA